MSISFDHKHTKECKVPCFKNLYEDCLALLLFVSLVMFFYGIICIFAGVAKW